jgi:hypothetical protein
MSFKKKVEEECLKSISVKALCVTNPEISEGGTREAGSGLETSVGLDMTRVLAW